MVLLIAVMCDLKVYQINMKTIFLDEEIYMEQLEGFNVPGQEKKV